uniref:Uncharacterized protein n=1 Tax=Naja naja TaxID=35670 RepID=A0A8C6X262_NAJNA
PKIRSAKDRINSPSPPQGKSTPTPHTPATSSPVRDYVVWSLFSFTTCNCCCLGLFALFYSIKSRDRKVLGDPEGAANHGRTAKYLNIAACLIGYLRDCLIPLHVLIPCHVRL